MLGTSLFLAAAVAAVALFGVMLFFGRVLDFV